MQYCTVPILVNTRSRYLILNSHNIYCLPFPFILTYSSCLSFSLDTYYNVLDHFSLYIVFTFTVYIFFYFYFFSWRLVLELFEIGADDDVLAGCLSGLYFNEGAKLSRTSFFDLRIYQGERGSDCVIPRYQSLKFSIF